MEQKILIEELPIFNSVKEELYSDDDCDADAVCNYEMPIKVEIEVSDSEIQVDTTEFKKKLNARNEAREQVSDSKNVNVIISSKATDSLKQVRASNTSNEIRKKDPPLTQRSDGSDNTLDENNESTFINKATINRHNEEFIQPRNFENVFKCTKCEKRFYKKYLFEAHIKGAHEGVERPYSCPHCPSNFRIYLLLNRHVRIKHPPNDGSSRAKIHHDCVHCQRKFSRKDHLKEHIRSVHERLRPFKCSICEKSFGSKGTQLRHEKNHSKNRPYTCDYCNKRYKSEYELQIHLQRHKTYPDLLCPICKCSKPNAEELQKHIGRHETSRQHLCPKCGKIFTKLTHVREHDITVHLKLRPYKCRRCGLAFGARKSLRLHERNHDPTGRSEHCSICQLYFQTKRSLALHMSKIHPNKKESEAQQKTSLPFDLWL